MQQQNQVLESYKKIRLLGKGSFGKAFLVECASDKSLAVIKKIDIQKMSAEERNATLRESKILELLNHPGIIHFKEVYKTTAGQLCIVMDYADGGDLAQMIKDHKQRKQKIEEHVVLNLFTQMLLAVKHCHEKKILHRDLKCGNVFLTKSGVVKIGDFGIARVLEQTNDFAATIVGTPYYLSPEIVQANEYNFKTDVWSLGVILYEMCALSPPFNGPNLPALAMQIVTGKYQPLQKNSYSQGIEKLISAMLTVDVNRRPNIDDVIKMPIISRQIQIIQQNQDFQAEFASSFAKETKVFERLKRQIDQQIQQKPWVVNVPIKQTQQQKEERGQKLIVEATVLPPAQVSTGKTAINKNPKISDNYKLVKQERDLELLQKKQAVLNQLIQTKESKDSKQQAKIRQAQLDKQKSELELAAVKAERMAERLKLEEDFKKKKRMAQKGEIKVEVLVPAVNSQQESIDGATNQKKKGAGEVFFVDFNQVSAPVIKAPPKQRFEKGVAFTIDFNNKEDPESVEPQSKMSELTKSYYDQYFKKISQEQPENKDESPQEESKQIITDRTKASGNYQSEADEEIYVDDFEILTEATMQQADLDQDRDDDIDDDSQMAVDQKQSQVWTVDLSSPSNDLPQKPEKSQVSGVKSPEIVSTQDKVSQKPF